MDKERGMWETLTGNVSLWFLAQHRVSQAQQEAGARGGSGGWED